jgi:hypothetical protein
VISDSDFEPHRTLNLFFPSIYIAVTIFGLVIIPHPCPLNEQELGLLVIFHCVKTSVEYFDKTDKPGLFYHIMKLQRHYIEKAIKFWV